MGTRSPLGRQHLCSKVFRDKTRGRKKLRLALPLQQSVSIRSKVNQGKTPPIET